MVKICAFFRAKVVDVKNPKKHGRSTTLQYIGYQWFGSKASQTLGFRTSKIQRPTTEGLIKCSP